MGAQNVGAVPVFLADAFPKPSAVWASNLTEGNRCEHRNTQGLPMRLPGTGPILLGYIFPSHPQRDGRKDDESINTKLFHTVWPSLSAREEFEETHKELA